MSDWSDHWKRLSRGDKTRAKFAGVLIVWGMALTVRHCGPVNALMQLT
jgi:hypothetical protein